MMSAPSAGRPSCLATAPRHGENSPSVRDVWILANGVDYSTAGCTDLGSGALEVAAGESQRSGGGGGDADDHQGGGHVPLHRGCRCAGDVVQD